MQKKKSIADKVGHTGYCVEIKGSLVRALVIVISFNWRLFSGDGLSYAVYYSFPLLPLTLPSKKYHPSPKPQLLIIWDLPCIELCWTFWWSCGLPTASKEKLKDRVRTADKPTCISKLRLGLSSEVNSPHQVKFSSACPMQNKCCEKTFHTPPHSISPPPKRSKKPNSFNTGQCTVHLWHRFWFCRTEWDSSKNV